MSPRLLCLVILLLCAVCSAGAQDAQSSIHVTGNAMVCVSPDEAKLSLGVESFHAQLDTAKQNNDAACASLLKALKALKIEDKHIQTDVLNVEIHYHDYSHPSSGIEGYYVRRAYVVTLKDIKLFDQLVDTALKNGANKLMGFNFQTTELRKHRDEARKRAIQAAREKAEALGAEMNKKPGKVIAIEEGYYAFSGIGSAYGYWNGGGGMQQMAQNYVSHTETGEFGGETAPLGEIGITAAIGVTFELIDVK